MKPSHAILISMTAVFALMRPGWAEPTQQKIEAIEHDIEKRQQRQSDLVEKADALQSEISQLRQSAQRLSVQLGHLNNEERQLTERLSELERTEQGLSEQLSVEQSSLVQALAALQILRADPPPAFATHPDDALKAVQGAIALAQVVPALRARADRLKARLSELTAIRRRIDTERTALAEAATQARATRDQLAETLNRRGRAERKMRADADQETATIAKLVARARDLRELSRELARRQKALADKQTAFSTLRGTLPPPAPGKISQYFGAVLKDGQKSQGIGIDAPAGAQIIAPYDGTILYAGRFRKYGQIIIIGIDSQFQLLLAGLNDSFGVVGQNVLTGEPLGFLAEKGDETAQPPLYMEIRDKGRPVDPLPWLDRG